MKIFKKITAFIFILSLAFACETDEDQLYPFEYIIAPSNVTVLYDITTDNSGLVTIFPAAEGAQKFQILFGDVVDEEPTEYNPGDVVTHTYLEGIYEVSITAFGITGLETESIDTLTISFKAPENLEIVVENDASTSKQVNISATADYAAGFEFYFGDADIEVPTLALPGEVAIHTYAEPGDYEITVVAKSAGAATTDSTFTFTVTEILAPIASAPTPPARAEADVISIFSSAYTDIEGINYNPDWGQSGQGSGFGEFDLNGDMMLQYINLSYQGITLPDGVSVDVSGMEYLHVDVWTLDVARMETSLINGPAGATEAPVWSDLTPDTWNSIDIPISDYTDQGLTVTEIFQLKLVGDPWAGGTVFVDNIYFYSESVPLTLPVDFESATVDYLFGDFGNVISAVVDNPDASGINVSAKVGQSLKPAGAATWAGTLLTLENPIDFSTNKIFKVKVWSPKAGATVKLKVENLTDSGIAMEIDAVTTVANAWEEITFDFSAIDTNNDYQKIVIFFDFGIEGDDSTYYFDDIELTN